MTPEIPDARLKEVTRWLRRQISLDDACARLTFDDQNVVHRKWYWTLFEWTLLVCTGIALVCLYRRIRDGRVRASEEYLREWIESGGYSADALWEYDTGGDSWENLCGECGYAIVRDGKVIDFWMYEMN
ncbi:MAG: hypothetical protein JNG89_07670 [Planctomycetaceae bacterium]|nr:hypothetical protein [Planctomycetaceae bacterium]